MRSEVLQSPRAGEASVRAREFLRLAKEVETPGHPAAHPVIEPSRTVLKLAASVVSLRVSSAYDLAKKINKHDRGKHPID